MGDLTRFPEMVDRLSPFAFSVALRMMGDEDEANDIVQEALICVWKTIKRLNKPDGFKAWFYRIVINKCYDRMRSMKRNREKIVDSMTWEVIGNRLSEAPDTLLENTEICSIIRALSDGLSPKQKAVFVLCDLEGMSHSEIAEITGMNSINIKSNLHHARRRIGELVKKHI